MYEKILFAFCTLSFESLIRFSFFFFGWSILKYYFCFAKLRQKEKKNLFYIILIKPFGERKISLPLQSKKLTTRIKNIS
tara:strand:+ start:31109 stop:31345 length:237 start_codon:yes stop_codon:yes gene_type:complete